MYCFSSLALTLNEEEEGVCWTDSRLRPDQRLMEAGRWDEANVEKQRLEEKQRATRRRREAEASKAIDEGERRSKVTQDENHETRGVIICIAAKTESVGLFYKIKITFAIVLIFGEKTVLYIT